MFSSWNFISWPRGIFVWVIWSDGWEIYIYVNPHMRTISLCLRHGGWTLLLCGCIFRHPNQTWGQDVWVATPMVPELVSGPSIGFWPYITGYPLFWTSCSVGFVRSEKYNMGFITHQHMCHVETFAPLYGVQCWFNEVPQFYSWMAIRRDWQRAFTLVLK